MCVRVICKVNDKIRTFAFVLNDIVKIKSVEKGRRRKKTGK